jgi:hypothetical protein
MRWQAGNRLHPGAQAPAEHRKNVSARRNRRADTTTPSWQSGHQSGAWSRHHPGASLPLAPRHGIDSIHTRPNNLISVSTFRVEDQEALAMDMAAEASVRDYCALMGSLLSAAHKAEPLTPEGKAGLQAAVIEIMDLMTDIWKAPGVGPEDRVARNNIGHPFT